MSLGHCPKGGWGPPGTTSVAYPEQEEGAEGEDNEEPLLQVTLRVDLLRPGADGIPKTRVQGRGAESPQGCMETQKAPEEGRGHPDPPSD